MAARVVAAAKALKWIYFGMAEVVGLAGMPDDVREWKDWMPPLVDFLEIWAVRAGLVLSGIAVITYGKWRPVLAGLLGRLAKSKKAPRPEPEPTPEDEAGKVPEPESEATATARLVAKLIKRGEERYRQRRWPRGSS